MLSFESLVKCKMYPSLTQTGGGTGPTSSFNLVGQQQAPSQIVHEWTRAHVLSHSKCSLRSKDNLVHKLLWFWKLEDRITTRGCGVKAWAVAFPEPLSQRSSHRSPWTALGCSICGSKPSHRTWTALGYETQRAPPTN